MLSEVGRHFPLVVGTVFGDTNSRSLDTLRQPELLIVARQVQTLSEILLDELPRSLHTVEIGVKVLARGDG